MPFTDVPNEWYHDAVLWAYDTGVVRGVSETEFAPMNLITREQMVTIFHRYAEYAGYDVSQMASIYGFADARARLPLRQDPIAWAVAAQDHQRRRRRRRQLSPAAGHGHPRPGCGHHPALRRLAAKITQNRFFH